MPELSDRRVSLVSPLEADSLSISMEETIFVTSIVLFLLLLHGCSSYSPPTTRIKASYWLSTTNFSIAKVEATLFTHLFYGFVYINSSSFRLTIPPSNQQHFSTFSSTIKRRNPSTSTLLSIANTPIYVSMLSSSIYREAYVNSTIQMARPHNYDGIDLVQDLPNTTTTITNQFSTLFDEWREAVNSEAKRLNKTRLILTTTVHYYPFTSTSSSDIYNYPVSSIQRNFDWVNVVAVNYFNPTRDASNTHFHASLYDPLSNVNTDFGIRKWIKSGLSKDKIVLGLPFYGCGWTLSNPNKSNSLGAPASGPAITSDGWLSYTYIKRYAQGDRLVVYNSTYVESYLSYGALWISFDDVMAVKTKVSYAVEMGLLGYYVYHVGSDDNWELSRAASDQMDVKGEPVTHENPEMKMDGKDQQKKRMVLVLAMILCAVFALLLVLLYYFRGRLLRHIRSRRNGTKSFRSESPDLKIFNFADIKAATDNFSFENKLGEGGYGPVYKGKLREGEEIAVKRLSKTSSQGYDELKNEVTLAAKLQHVNLVKVMGFCTDRDEKMLIYEYLPNKSLDLYLFDPMKRYELDWDKRVEIVEGIIQGLVYLQEYSRLTIIHKDLKASNVLLDKELRPKISDFGLARIFQMDEYEANTHRLIRCGYVPPEYLNHGVYSTKYDVYSFGVLLLHIISGKRDNCFYGVNENLSLLDYVYELWKDGRAMEFIDPSLDDSSSKCKLERCLQMALLCVQKRPEDRPSMLEVSLVLKNENEEMVTPKMPAFSVNIDEGPEFVLARRPATYSSNTVTVSEIDPR